jgi:hypothetical protein
LYSCLLTIEETEFSRYSKLGASPMVGCITSVSRPASLLLVLPGPYAGRLGPLGGL